MLINQYAGIQMCYLVHKLGFVLFITRSVIIVFLQTLCRITYTDLIYTIFQCGIFKYFLMHFTECHFNYSIHKQNTANIYFIDAIRAAFCGNLVSVLCSI